MILDCTVRSYELLIGDLINIVGYYSNCGYNIKQFDKKSAVLQGESKMEESKQKGKRNEDTRRVKLPACSNISFQ